MNIKEQEGRINKYIAEASTADYAKLSTDELQDLLSIFSNVGRSAAKPVIGALKKELISRRKNEDEELEEAKVVPFKKLEQAWTRTNGDKDKQAKLIKKHDLKKLISTVRPGEIKLGVKNKLLGTTKAATAAGLDLDDELIFVTNNPLKIIYPKKSTRRPEGEEIKEAVKVKKDIKTLRLEKIAEVALRETDQSILEAFAKSDTFQLDSTMSAIKESFKIFEAATTWIIYDTKTGERLSPTKSWKKWQGVKAAAAKMGGNAKPADAAWYHDNKAKLMGEAVDLEEAKRMKYDKVIKKLKDGEWDTSMDVKQRMHLTYTDNKTGKKKVVFVESDDLEEATAPKKLDTEINTGPFDSKQKNSILSIIKMLPGKITDNSKATDVNGGGQLGVEIDGKVYVWFTMSVLGHTGSVELKPASGKKRSTNSKDFKNIAGGSGQKALVAYVKELLSMNEATELEEATKWWTVTITKKAGKLFKGQTVDVKARNSAEAIKKGIKQMKGDPMTVPSGSVDAILGESTDLEEGIISNVVKSVAAKFDDAAVKKLIGAVNGSTAIEVIIELDKLSPKKRANLHRAITSWIERNSNNAAVKQLTRLQTSLKESTDLEEASKADIKKVLTAAKKAGGTIKGNQIDFGMGAVIDVSIEKGKIKLDAGQSNGVELFDNVKDAIMAFESVDLELEEAFSRLPGNVINNELYVANRALQAFASSQTNGDDVDEKKLNQLIKALQAIKKEVKKFNNPEDVPLKYQYKSK